MSSPNKKLFFFSTRASLIALVIVLISVLVAPILLNYFTVEREIASTFRTVLYILLGIMLGGIVLQYLLIYLESGNTLKPPELKGSADEPLSYVLKDISEQLAAIKEQIKNIKTVEFDIKDVSLDELVQSLKSTVNQKFIEGALKSIDEELAGRDLRNKKWERFITGFEEIRNRLSQETNNLAKRANINLLIGIAITGVAGIGLIYIVFASPLELTKTNSLYVVLLNPFILPEVSKVNVDTPPYGWLVAAHYIPRLSLIVFAQLFAYFFLRLYKSGLEDIKYYQNELTNVELKISALKVALAAEDNEILKLVIGELAKVERNFILKKDETTVEIEKIRTESLDTKNWLEHIKTLLETKK